MSASPVGRNDPCPCGSGKKYKKCCQPKEPAPGRVDGISHNAVIAIKAKRYGEAEKLCEQLLRDFPEDIDGHDLLGSLRKAQGRFQEAADHFTQALSVIDRHPGDYDADIPALLRRERDEVLAKVTPPS
jgi:tetratricopeptide (TPR) repeat protein